MQNRARAVMQTEGERDIGSQKREGNNGKKSGIRREIVCVEGIVPAKQAGFYKGKNERKTAKKPNICSVGGKDLGCLFYYWPSGSYFMYCRQQLELSF